MHTQLGSNAQGPKIPLPAAADHSRSDTYGQLRRSLQGTCHVLVPISINGDLIPC
jgi:hypothetical protein